MSFARRQRRELRRKAIERQKEQNRKTNAEQKRQASTPEAQNRKDFHHRFKEAYKYVDCTETSISPARLQRQMDSMSLVNENLGDSEVYQNPLEQLLMRQCPEVDSTTSQLREVIKNSRLSSGPSPDRRG